MLPERCPSGEGKYVEVDKAGTDNEGIYMLSINPIYKAIVIYSIDDELVLNRICGQRIRPSTERSRI